MTTYGSILHCDNREERKGEDFPYLCSHRRGELSSSSSSSSSSLSSATAKFRKVVYDDGDDGNHCSHRGRRSQKSMVVSVAIVAVVVVVAAATILAAAIVAPRQHRSSNNVSDAVVDRSRQEVLLPPHFLRTHPTAYYESKNNMDQQDDRFFFYGDDDIKLMRDKRHRKKKKKNDTESTKSSQNSSSSSSDIEDTSPPVVTTSAPSDLSSEDDDGKNEDDGDKVSSAVGDEGDDDSVQEQQEVEEDSSTTATTEENTQTPVDVSTPTKFTPIAGFTADLLDYDSPSLLHWYCEPGKGVCASSSQSFKNDDGNGSDDDLGYWGLVSSSRSDTPHYKLIFSPPPRHDFWRHTFYEPTLLKDDGSFLYTVVPQRSMPITVSTSFTLHNPNSQFDAAGIMIRLDSNHWIKTGIEVVDQQPRVSCVVTNTYSDWSTESYGPPIVGPQSSSLNSGSTKSSVRLQLRVHMLPRHGGSFVVEIVPYDDTSKTSDEEDEINWTMIRMAHLNKAMVDPTVADENDENNNDGDTAYEGPAAPDGSYMVGVYASSPVGTAQPPMVAVFHSFTVSEGSDFDQGGF